MAIQFFEETNAATRALPRSLATKAGGFVFVGGQVARGETGTIIAGGIEAQTRPMRIRLFHVLAACALAFPSSNFAASPYVGEQSRSIKSLSDQELSDYEAGRGMGFAKAAELNGYPGPAHVLELGDQLALSPEQRERTEQLFQRMQTRARALGRRLVEEERQLDGMFASKAISRAQLADALSSIAALQSEIRKTHLQAHLEQSEILSEAQTTRYWHLRGYADGHAPPHHKH